MAGLHKVRTVIEGALLSGVLVITIAEVTHIDPTEGKFVSCALAAAIPNLGLFIYTTLREDIQHNQRRSPYRRWHTSAIKEVVIGAFILHMIALFVEIYDYIIKAYFGEQVLEALGNFNGFVIILAFIVPFLTCGMVGIRLRATTITVATFYFVVEIEIYYVANELLSTGFIESKAKSGTDLMLGLILTSLIGLILCWLPYAVGRLILGQTTKPASWLT